MKINKEDLINKFETLEGYLRTDRILDSEFKKELCDEVIGFINDLKENNIELIN